jgi:hypothetical protein
LSAQNVQDQSRSVILGDGRAAVSETPIYDDVLGDTGIDPEPIGNRELWSIARQDELLRAAGLGRRVLTPG